MTAAELISLLRGDSPGDAQGRNLTEANRIERRLARYVLCVSSLKATEEAKDTKHQRELLTILERRADADLVASAIREKLVVHSSAAVETMGTSFPDWYIWEDQIERLSKKPVATSTNGQIFSAVRSPCKTPVAVKIFNSDLDWSERGQQKFICKVLVWRKLDHPNLRLLHGACYLTTKPFVVMEYLDGYRPLSSLFRERAVELLACAGEGIAAMHAFGVVHGDIKCENILVKDDESSLVKVCGFGYAFDWASQKAQGFEDASAEAAGVETTKAIKWISPECTNGKLPSPASDVYAFGMTIYEALTGKSPFYHLQVKKELKFAKLIDNLPLRNFETIDDRVWGLIQRTSNRSPLDRPTMCQVVKSLRSLVGISDETSHGNRELQQLR